MIDQASSYPGREGEGKGEREEERRVGRMVYISHINNYCILSHLGREFIDKKIM